jgi:hypothetical protein
MPAVFQRRLANGGQRLPPGSRRRLLRHRLIERRCRGHRRNAAVMGVGDLRCIQPKAVGSGALSLSCLDGPGLAVTRHGLPTLERQFTAG